MYYGFWFDGTFMNRLVIQILSCFSVCLLQTYYAESYTHPIIPRVTCPLVTDIFQTMDRAMNSTWDYENLHADAYENGYIINSYILSRYVRSGPLQCKFLFGYRL